MVIPSLFYVIQILNSYQYQYDQVISWYVFQPYRPGLIQAV